MSWQTILEPETSVRLCLALLHSLWQVALAALLASAVCRVWRKTSVDWNYLVHVAALVISVTAVPVIFLFVSAEIPFRVAANTRALVDVPKQTKASGRPQLPSPPSPPKQPPIDAHDDVSTSTSHIEPTTAAKRPTAWTRFAPWLAGLYAAGVAAMLVRLLAGVISAERMRRHAQPVENRLVVAALRGIARQWNLRVFPALAQAECIVVPTLVGLVKPTILVPVSAISGLSPAEWEMILSHELAHVRRGDMWVNLLQRLAEVALFFNPALWYLSRRIATLREYCCDELVCQRHSANATVIRVNYAAALLRVVELARPTAVRDELAALAASGRSPSELRRRIARLFGEPLGEPLRASRSGLLVTAAMALVFVVGTGWLRSRAQTIDESPDSKPVNFHAPTSEADRIVAAARAQTFGLQDVPRISIRQSYWNADVVAMQKVPDNSLPTLWQARGENVDETMRRNTSTAVTIAWDSAKLLVQTDSNMTVDATMPHRLYTQSRYWDGREGWLGETSPQARNIYRYAGIEELMDHLAEFYFPHWSSAGGRLPWSGPIVVLEEYKVDPELTRYQLTGTEAIDGVECYVYDGPARHERLWIEKPTGLLKAMSHRYAQNTLPNYYTQLVREVAGRTFADAGEYRQWVKDQPAELQAKLGAHWATAHWPLTVPGNLSVFSDYREIAPGVRWPMHCERIVVHPVGQNAASGYRYIRGEVIVSSVAEEFSIHKLAEAALPLEGDAVTDRRIDPAIEYVWKSPLQEGEIEIARKAKLDQRRRQEEAEQRINETTINSVDDAIRILTEGPKADPTIVWARAIKYLVDHKGEGLPAVIKQLDAATRDHPISKLAFALRAIGDRRAVPALIRALPRTLLPGRSDYGLICDDPALRRFMQQHDQHGAVRDGGDYFDYGRAFREVTSALHRLTGQDFGEMELNWVHLAESPTQRGQQRAQFHQFAERWADWWEANWESMIDDPAYAVVNLPLLVPEGTPFAGRAEPPSGPGVRLQDGRSGWIVEAVQESPQRSFVDLDTMREGGWPASLPPVEEVGVDSPELLAWTRREGFDMVGVTHTPPGESEPIYCLKPLDMHAWQITPQEHRRLEQAMAGREPYPLSRPVQLMVPQREVKPPYDYQYGGDAFLFVTREGTAGVIRMTAQVTNTGVGGAYSRDAQFLPVGFHRGAKISFAAMTEAEAPTDNSADGTKRDNSIPPLVPPDVHHLKVIVVDSEGKPLKAVKVFQNHVHIPRDAPTTGKRTQIKNQNYFTDDAGQAVLTWSGESIDLRIWVSKADHVPLHAMWAKDFQADGELIPAEFTFVMKSGTKIGGVVKNERGDSVAGAKVEIQNAIATAYAVVGSGRKAGMRPVPCIWLAEGGSAIVTDADGRWSATNIPADSDLQLVKGVEPFGLPPGVLKWPLRLRVSHEDYETFDGNQNVNSAGAPSLAELRDQNALVVLKLRGASHEPASNGTGLPEFQFDSPRSAPRMIELQRNTRMMSRVKGTKLTAK